MRDVYKDAADNKYNPTWMLIATWEGVMPYRPSKNYTLPSKVRLVFQVKNRRVIGTKKYRNYGMRMCLSGWHFSFACQ